MKLADNATLCLVITDHRQGIPSTERIYCAKR